MEIAPDNIIPQPSTGRNHPPKEEFNQSRSVSGREEGVKSRWYFLLRCKCHYDLSVFHSVIQSQEVNYSIQQYFIDVTKHRIRTYHQVQIIEQKIHHLLHNSLLIARKRALALVTCPFNEFDYFHIKWEHKNSWKITPTPRLHWRWCRLFHTHPHYNPLCWCWCCFLCLSLRIFSSLIKSVGSTPGHARPGLLE